MLYFAYGANLCKIAMRMRCPAAADLCAAVLPDHRLVFRTYADVEPKAGATVQGALWALSFDCAAALDRFEGVANGHYRRDRVMVRRVGSPGVVEAMVYRHARLGYAPPPDTYLAVTRQGYADFGLNEADLVEAAARAGA